MNVQPIFESKLFDLFILGSNAESGSKAMAKPYGFQGLSLGLQHAQDLAQSSRRQGWGTVMVPVEYRDAELSLPAARALATEAFEHHKAKFCELSFGDLDLGTDEGGWWFFVADNLTAQEAGSIPGLLIIRIDKILKRPLTPEENRWVESIQSG
jgi:hypothetical protein